MYEPSFFYARVGQLCIIALEHASLMTKKQFSRRGRRPLNRRGPRGNRDPSFTHVLSYLCGTSVSAPGNGFVGVVPINQLSGFNQLGTFFEMYKPTKYRLKISYTNWSGTMCFVPQNPIIADSPPTLTSTDPLAVMEVRGSVRVQAGYNNTGTWCTFPFTNVGLQTHISDTTPLIIGYLLAYNDAPLVSNWTIQATLEVETRFFRRTLYYYLVGPTLSTRFVLASEAIVTPVEEESKEDSHSYTSEDLDQVSYDFKRPSRC